MSLMVRYPGRACLLGEHCDWAGGASLAVPLPLGLVITAEEGGQDLRATSALEGQLLEGRWPLEGRVDRGGGPLRYAGAAASLLHERGLRLPPTHLWIRADLPAGRGFSSSAACSLALIDALARRAGEALDAAELAELAYILEHDLLGVDCGRLDPLCCAAAAPVFLRWSEGRAPLRRVLPAGRAWLLAVALPQPRNTPLILSELQAHWGGAAPAGPAVDAVRGAIQAFGVLAEAGALALERGDHAALGAAMDAAQTAYEEMAQWLGALEAPQMSGLCRALREGGALGAKFSGAGGEGSVIALYDRAEQAMEAEAALAPACTALLVELGSP
jgi:mevalonate kinase